MCGNQSQKTDWAVLNWEEFNHLLDMKTISWQVQNTQPSQPITWSILTNNNTKHPKQPFNRIINSCGWSRQVHLSWLHTVIHCQVCYPDRVCRQDKLLLNTILCLYQSCILSVQLYGSESWTLLQEDTWKLLESLHLRCQWQILNIHWNDC